MRDQCCSVNAMRLCSSLRARLQQLCVRRPDGTDHTHRQQAGSQCTSVLGGAPAKNSP